MLKLYDPQIRNIESIISDLESNDKTKIANALADFVESSNNVSLMLEYLIKFTMHPDEQIAAGAIYKMSYLALIFPRYFTPKSKKIIFFLNKLRRTRIELDGHIEEVIEDIRHLCNVFRKERRKRRKRKKLRNCL